MILRPTQENEASEEVSEYYRQLKDAFGIHFVPIFFRYIGSFPQYCEYITSQIMPLVKDERFSKLTEEQCKLTKEILSEYFPKGEDTQSFLKKLKDSVEYYQFQKDLFHIFSGNTKIVIIFIAIREAVKGWAIAAKKLTAKTEYGQPDVRVEGNVTAAFVYEDFIQKVYTREVDDRGIPIRSNQELARTNDKSITQSLLSSYMQLVKREYEVLSKTERFLYFRVEMEKIIVSKLDLLPQKIESPINIVLELTQKYPTFAELLHLLSDQFPTTAMHRYLFSGWILP